MPIFNLPYYHRRITRVCSNEYCVTSKLGFLPKSNMYSVFKEGPQGQQTRQNTYLNMHRIVLQFRIFFILYFFVLLRIFQRNQKINHLIKSHSQILTSGLAECSNYDRKLSTMKSYNLRLKIQLSHYKCIISLEHQRQYSYNIVN